MTADSISLILASQSPRRRQLLQSAGYAFDVVLPHELAECGVCSRETPPELVARLAWQKAADVARRGQAPAIILGCDTVAECQGIILGKPSHRDHAREMLRRLRGREHRVYSGVCLWRRPDDRQLVRVEVTRLVMDSLSDEQLEEYLESGDWEGKAGAFGYQDGLDWVHILEGSESNVVGLPLELLAEMLEQIARDESGSQSEPVMPSEPVTQSEPATQSEPVTKQQLDVEPRFDDGSGGGSDADRGRVV